MALRIAAAAPRGNRLLGSLPTAKRRQLIARCERVDLVLGEVLCKAGDQIRHVYFPTGSFIALISAVDRVSQLEVGLVGAEGMFGISLLLGEHAASVQAVVQGAGPALRMDAAQFSRELKRNPGLTKTLNSYVCVLLSQLSQTAACTRYHVVEPRLARWLLMTRDRAHANDFCLTQEHLAHLLGVRRSGITLAAGSLQQRELIRYKRGNIRILDGRGLEAASCECYAVARDVYSRLMM